MGDTLGIEVDAGAEDGAGEDILAVETLGEDLGEVLGEDDEGEVEDEAAVVDLVFWAGPIT